MSGKPSNQTGIIKYNLKDRGRKFRGKERNFDIPAIVRAINSGATQEKVKHRDMFGYYGHWPRIKFGLNPAEGGIVDGRHVSIEPAMVTIHLKAYDDGTIEHEAEFLDTNSGNLAQRLFARKTGGFSSAIDELKPEFYGFDYVLEPNFTTNRGYELSLDSVGSSGMTLDDIGNFVADEYNRQLIGVLKLLDSLNNEHANALDIVAKLTAENEHYLSLISSSRGAGVALDSLSFESISPLVVDKNSAHRLMGDIAYFKDAPLFGVEVPGENKAKKVDENDRITNRFIR
ncbi:hypothetical protein [Undibacterium crateris]|uniref:hypothetical protein n=1 Tax=Undibacterium crateris TaxID=2528175 RepID=UPI001389812A|nr:hypothetical protein [Undibacterium crateris]NDI85085.1 hypothetical protein [Undibacterium crateris]